MSSTGRYVGQRQNGLDTLEDVVEEQSISETSFEQQPPPRHPIPTMQGAFEESILEEAEESALSKKDAVYRRKILLERPQYQRIVGSKWTQKPGERFHPLWKLVSQLAFGMHLLHSELAKSEEEVIKILQTHVDEVDGFLERTTEDFDLAQHDINERIKYLLLPLEHSEVFDTMLMDRTFRTAMVDGNVKIEHIVDRTAMALTDSLKDIKKGSDGTKELARYLRRLEKSWRGRDSTITEVFHAMMGNTEGWTAALTALTDKGKALDKSLDELRAVIAEIQQRVGVASRRDVPQPHTQAESHHDLSAEASQSSPRSRSPEENGVVVTDFAAIPKDTGLTNGHPAEPPVSETKTRVTSLLHANAILEEEEEEYEYDTVSPRQAQASPTPAQAPTIVSHPETIIEEDESPPAPKNNNILQTQNIRNLTQEDRTSPTPNSGAATLGAIASAAAIPSNTHPKPVRMRSYDDTERIGSGSRPSGRFTLTPRPEAILEEDEESDGSEYTADIVTATPVIGGQPNAVAIDKPQPQAQSRTVPTTESGEVAHISDNVPSSVKLQSTVSQPSTTNTNETTKEFTLPPLDLESETPLPAMTPLDYERMKADRTIPSFDLQIPEEYAMSKPSTAISDSKSTTSIQGATNFESSRQTGLGRQPAGLDPELRKSEESKVLSHPYNQNEVTAGSFDRTLTLPFDGSSKDYSSVSSLDESISASVIPKQDFHRQESPLRLALGDGTRSSGLDMEDSISYTDQYSPHSERFPSHLDVLPTRGDSLILSDDQFAPDPDQFYEDSKRSSGGFIPDPDQFYQDSRSEYSLKFDYLSNGLPDRSKSLLDVETDKVSDSSSSMDDNQSLEDMATPRQKARAVFDEPATDNINDDHEFPPSEDEQKFPLPPHVDVFTRTHSMSERIRRKPVPKPQLDDEGEVDSPEESPAFGLGIGGTSAAAVIAVTESSRSGTPTLTKQPRQLPIDDLLVRLRHGAGLITPTGPDARSLPGIYSSQSQSDYLIESYTDDNELRDDLLIPPGIARTPSPVSSDYRVDPENEHDFKTSSAGESPGETQADRTAPADGISSYLSPPPPQTFATLNSHQNTVRSQAERYNYLAVDKESSSRQLLVQTIPVIEILPVPVQNENKPRTHIQREFTEFQLPEQIPPIQSQRQPILEPRLQRRASYSDDRSAQRLSATRQSGITGDGLLSPDSAAASPRHFPHSALVPASSPWTFFSRADMDHSYRHRRAHSLYSPATPYDLEWLLRRTPSDMAVSPMRWSEIYGFRSGHSSAVSPLNEPFSYRFASPPITKKDVSIDSIISGNGNASSKFNKMGVANLGVQDFAAVRGQISQAADVKPIPPAWREPTLREQKADRPTVRASSIYSKAPDLDLGYSPPPEDDIPLIIRTQTGYDSFYSDDQPSAAYTDMTFGQISPAPAISSAKPSPLHFAPREIMQQVPAAPASPQEEPKYPVEVLDEKQTVVDMPPISPSLQSLTSATVTGPEPDFPFLSATYNGPEPDYYYFANAVDEPEVNQRKQAKPETSAANTTNLFNQQYGAVPSLQADDGYLANEQQQRTAIEPNDTLPLRQVGGFSTSYNQNTMSKKREGPPAALNLSLFPSPDSISRAATSPRSPRPQEILAESGRSMMGPRSPRPQEIINIPGPRSPRPQIVNIPGPTMSNPNLPSYPPPSEEPVLTAPAPAPNPAPAPTLASAPTLAPTMNAPRTNKSPLKNLFKSVSPSLFGTRVKRDKSHRRGKSNGGDSLARDVTIANAQMAAGVLPDQSINGSTSNLSYTEHTAMRKGSMPNLNVERRPSGERVLFGMPGADGRPF